MRRAALGLVTVITLGLSGLAPAAAASTPSKVGLVSFVASAFSRNASGGTASMTVDWSGVSNAKSYEIFVSTSGYMTNAKKYTSTQSIKKVVSLKPGTSYFIQVRGVNGSRVGAKSTRVGHTTIRDQGPASGPTYRVMTYNVCSEACDDNGTASTDWLEGRQARAHGRVTAYKPDVIAAQEAGDLALPPGGYSEAYYKSAKRLFFKTARFTQAPADPSAPPAPSKDSNECSPTWSNGSSGHVLLGFHSSKCRYAVWAELVDNADPSRRTIFFDVHTVSGDSTAREEDRREEIRAIFLELPSINPEGLPVVFAGDFNSHKNRSNDTVGTVMRQKGYYDAYDLAMKLYRQHNNSYNDFQITPKISYTWGDHVDHVYVIPSKTRVLSWVNGAWIANGKMVTPIPSDHSPIVVDVQVN